MGCPKSQGITTTISFAGIFIADFPAEFQQHILFMSVLLTEFRRNFDNVYFEKQNHV